MKALWLFFFLAACASGSRVMTMQSFSDIPLGASTSEVTSAAGPPYAIYRYEDGSVEYEYIERFKAGSRNIEQRHYYFLLKEGKVASKRVKQSSPPPYTFDSYEMQTTQGQNP